jgi:hypothetical protein
MIHKRRFGTVGFRPVRTTSEYFCGALRPAVYPSSRAGRWAIFQIVAGFRSGGRPCPVGEGSGRHVLTRPGSECADGSLPCRGSRFDRTWSTTGHPACAGGKAGSSAPALSARCPRDRRYSADRQFGARGGRVRGHAAWTRSRRAAWRRARGHRRAGPAHRACGPLIGWCCGLVGGLA